MTPVETKQKPQPRFHILSPKRRKIWGGRTFRLNFQNFRFNDSFSIRQFSIVEAALLLMFALLTSRVLGVVRQVTFSAMFNPASDEVNAYIAASKLPDTLYNLIAGGALIHAFVPVFLSFEKEQGEKEAWRLTSLVFNVLLVLLTLILLLSEFFTPQFVTHILAPGFSPHAKEVTVTLTRIMLIQPLILGLGTIASAILNSKRQFLLPALSLAVYNIGMLIGLLATKVEPSIGIYGPTFGTLLAVSLQVSVLLPGLFKQKIQYSFIWNLRHPGLREVFILLLPNALAIGVASFGNIADTQVSSLMNVGPALAALQNAEMLQALPIALIAQAVGQSLLPHISAHVVSGRYIRMQQTIIKIVGVALLLTIPAMLLLALAGQPLIHLLFRHGAFTLQAAHLTYIALLGFIIAIPGTAAGPLLAAGFFAFKDAFTPFLTNTFGLLIRWGMLYAFLAILPFDQRILVVPLAAAVASTLESLLLTLLLWLRLQKHVHTDLAQARLIRRRQYIEQSKKIKAASFRQ